MCRPKRKIISHHRNRTCANKHSTMNTTTKPHHTTSHNATAFCAYLHCRSQSFRRRTSASWSDPPSGQTRSDPVMWWNISIINYQCTDIHVMNTQLRNMYNQNIPQLFNFTSVWGVHYITVVTAVTFIACTSSNLTFAGNLNGAINNVNTCSKHNKYAQLSIFNKLF